MMNLFGKWAKRILTGFFVLIFTLGFFSKSLINLTLPNVQVAELNDGIEVNYTSEIRGEIVAKKTTDICLMGDVVIQEVYIKNGSYVLPGTPLFKIDNTLGLMNKDDPKLLHNKINAEQERTNTLLSKSKLEYQTAMGQINNNILQATQDLKAQKELFASGAVTRDTILSAENQLKVLEINKQTLSRNYQLQQAQDQLAVNEAQTNINAYKKQLEVLKTGANRYYEVNALGEVLSKTKGYMIKVPEKGNNFRTGEIIMSIGECKTYEDLAFEIKMSQRDYNSFKKGNNVVSISTDDGDYIGVVAFDYDLSIFSNGEMKVMASFTDEPKITVYPGQSVSSRTQNAYYVGGEKLAVPKTAIVSSGKQVTGENALIYLLREEEDALGKSQVAVATPVTVVSVGDDYAIIVELRSMPTNKVIVNPTAKIKDGTKVYVCP